MPVGHHGQVSDSEWGVVLEGRSLKQIRHAVVAPGNIVEESARMVLDPRAVVGASLAKSSVWA